MIRALFLLIFFVINTEATAQIGIGIKGATQFATLHVQQRPEFFIRSVNPVRNSQYGIILRYASKKNTGLQLEVNLNEKGWKDENDTSNVVYSRNIRYLEVPFLTHVYLGNKSFRIIADGGPYVAYALSSEQSTYDPETDIEQSSEYTFRDGRDNKWDYGLLLQAGVQYNFSFGSIHAEAFYSYGYGNVFSDKAEASELTQNRTYGITIGYLHFLKKFD